MYEVTMKLYFPFEKKKNPVIFIESFHSTNLRYESI